MWDVIETMKGARSGETLTDVLGRRDEAERNAAAKEHTEALFKHGDWSPGQDRLFPEDKEAPVIAYRRRERDSALEEF